jgi:hypothetical protein
LQVIINPRQDRPIDLTCKETGIIVVFSSKSKATIGT